MRPAAKQVIEIPSGHRFGFYNLRHALTSRLVVEIGTDSKTIQDMLRWADPSILLKVYAHARMDKRMEVQAKMVGGDPKLSIERFRHEECSRPFTHIIKTTRNCALPLSIRA